MVLLGGQSSGPFLKPPSEFLLSGFRRSRAARLIVSLFVLLFIFVVCLFIYWNANMGQSLTTPLSLTLDHWSDVSNRASNRSLEVKKKKWRTFCSSEWPAFNLGWPRDGTFDKNIILQVKERVFDKGPHGHPDQVAYIVTWESLAYDPPPPQPVAFPVASRLRGKCEPSPPDSTSQAFPLQQGNSGQLQYWPFSASAVPIEFRFCISGFAVAHVSGGDREGDQ